MHTIGRILQVPAVLHHEFNVIDANLTVRDGII